MKSFFIDIFRRNIYLLLTAFGLFLFGYLLNLYFSGDASIAVLRNSIQSFMQERERDFGQLTKDTALLDRLVDGAAILKINGKSYRAHRAERASDRKPPKK